MTGEAPKIGGEELEALGHDCTARRTRRIGAESDLGLGLFLPSRR
jgi:hypothetical protein